MANLSGFFRYYGQVFRCAFKSVWHFGMQHLIISIILAIFILILQILFGMIAKDMNFAAWVSVITPYLGILIISFIVGAIRAPYVLDRKKQLGLDEERQRKLAAAQLQTDVLQEELKAARLELEKLKAEKAESQKHKLIFEIDMRNTRIRVEQTKSAIRIFAAIQLRFENRDTHPLSVKRFDISLHRMGIKDVRSAEDIFTLFAILRLSSNGDQLNTKLIETMTISGHQLSPFYLIKAMIAIVDEENIKTAGDLDATDYLRITMQSSGNQPEFMANLHPHWKGALEKEGTSLVIVTGAPSIAKDFRRID